MKVEAFARFSGGAYAPKSVAAKMLKRTFRAIGTFWHTTMAPRHFLRSAFSEYGYTPRKRTYEKRKRRYLGHADPLTFTGQSKQLAQRRRVIATRKGARVNVPVRAFNFRPKGSAVNMVREWRAISGQEEKRIDRFAEQGLELRMKRYNQAAKIGVV